MFDPGDNFLSDVAALFEIDPVELVEIGFVGECVGVDEVKAATRHAKRDAMSLAVGKPFEEHRWGYIDAAGKWAIPPKFYDAADFSDGLAPVEIGDLADR